MKTKSSIFSKKVARDAVAKGSNLQFQAITYAYGYAFYGDFRDEKGILQLADLTAAQGIIDSFLDIDVDQLNRSDLEAWLDIFFKMSVGIITLKTDNDLDDAISRSYQRIAQDRNYKPALHRQTGVYYEMLDEYGLKVRLEKAVEGRIVTPLEEYRNEIRGIIQKRISDFIDNNFMKLIDASNKALKRAYALQEHTLLANILWMQFHWINNCFVNENFERAALINIITDDNLPYVLRLPVEDIKKVELLEELEKGFFIAALEKQKDCYITFLKGLMFLHVVLQPKDPRDSQSILRSARRVYSQAIFVFYASEYYQDHFYIKEFLRELGPKLKVSVYDMLLYVNDLKIYEIYWETQTFHRWFLVLDEQIRGNTRVIRDSHAGGIGFRTIYDHPSPNTRSFQLLKASQSSNKEWKFKLDAAQLKVRRIMRLPAYTHEFAPTKSYNAFLIFQHVKDQAYALKFYIDVFNKQVMGNIARKNNWDIVPSLTYTGKYQENIILDLYEKFQKKEISYETFIEQALEKD